MSTSCATEHCATPPPCCCLGCHVSVIARTFLAPFDCSGSKGVYTMDADPSIRCDGNPTHRRMVIVALCSIGAYGVGVPLGFAWILSRNQRGEWLFFLSHLYT